MKAPILRKNHRKTNPVRSKPKLLSVREYSLRMKQLSYLSCLNKDQRDSLLQELYHVAKRMVSFESWAQTERSEASDFRTWRQFLGKARPRLSEALHELVTVADLAAVLPRESEVELYFDGEQFRQGIITASQALLSSINLAVELESIVVALINPMLRTKREKTLVKTELTERYSFPPGTKSSFLDHWLIVEAASRLDKYRDAAGKKIPRYDYVISELFKAAFDRIQTAENVRTVLLRKLRKAPSGNPNLHPAMTNPV